MMKYLGLVDEAIKRRLPATSRALRLDDLCDIQEQRMV